MNQVNLMNLLYAVPEVAGVQLPGGQQANQEQAGGLDFLLNLKQEIWAAQMPQFGVGLLTSAIPAAGDVDGVFAGFQETIQVDGQQPAAMSVNGKLMGQIGAAHSVESVALLDLLTASLKQAAEVITFQAQAGKPTEVAIAGDQKVAPAAMVIESIPADSQTPLQLQLAVEAGLAEQEILALEQRLVGARQGEAGLGLEEQSTVTAAGKEALLQSPELALADTWRIASGVLKSELQQQGVELHVSAPKLKVTQVPTEKSPWGLVFSESSDKAENAGKGITNPGERISVPQELPIVVTQPKAVMPGPAASTVATSQQGELSNDAPASIRWFAQPTGDVSNNISGGAKPTGQAIATVKPMAAEVLLADDTRLKVTVTPIAQQANTGVSTKSEAIELHLNLALVGEADVALEAKLTLLPVTRRSLMPQVPVPMKPVGTQEIGLSPALPPVIDRGGLNPDGKPGLEIPEQVSLLNSGARPGGLELNGSGLSRMVVSQSADQLVGEAELAGRPQANSQSADTLRNGDGNQQLRPEPVVMAGETASKIAPPIKLHRSLKNDVLKGENVEPQGVTKASGSSHRAELVAASQAAQTKKAMIADFGQKPASRLLALSQLPQLAETISAGDVQTANVAQFGIGAQELPTQLLQFSSTVAVQKPLNGLNYLELANRMLDKVADAKAKGNGVYSAKLTLNPANLGQMLINIAVTGESVALQVAVAAGVPKALLKESMDALQLSLEEAGLDVIEFRVEELGSDQEGSPDQHQAQDTPTSGPSRMEGFVEPAEAFIIHPELLGETVPA